jgi:hypothetical protein
VLTTILLSLALSAPGQVPQVPVYAEVVTSGAGGPGTGQPLPGMWVAVRLGGTVLAQGVTGSDGQMVAGLVR